MGFTGLTVPSTELLYTENRGREEEGGSFRDCRGREVPAKLAKPKQEKCEWKFLHVSKSCSNTIKKMHHSKMKGFVFVIMQMVLVLNPLPRTVYN